MRLRSVAFAWRRRRSVHPIVTVRSVLPLHGSYLIEVVAVLLIVGCITVRGLRQRTLALAGWYVGHVPQAARTWVSVLAGVLTVTLAFAADGVGSVARVHFTAALIVFQLIATGLPLFERRKASDLATEAVHEATRGVNRSLVPLTGLVKEITEPPRNRPGRQQARGRAQVVALTAAATLMGGPRDIRASWFALEGVAPTRRLVPPATAASVGRQDMAHTMFDETTPDGRRVFEALDAGKLIHDPDCGGTAYKSYVSAPVIYAGQLLGMLSVDSPVVDDFDEVEDFGLAITLSHLLATALKA